jgi:hypothetical protein
LQKAETLHALIVKSYPLSHFLYPPFCEVQINASALRRFLFASDQAP